MWTPLSASRWVLLLTLGVVMLLSESEAAEHDCCYGKDFTDEKFKTEDIEKCVEQKSSKACAQYAYWIKLKDGNGKCIDPKADWLNNLITQGEIKCHGRFKPVPMFEVLDEDEEEEEDEDEEEEEEKQE